MSFFEPISNVPNYQFQPWSSSSSRPQSGNRRNDSINDLSKLTIDNQKASSSKMIREYHVHIPTGSRFPSPPPQPNPSPDLTTPSLDNLSRKLSSARRYRSIPFRIKSTSLAIPTAKHPDEEPSRNFPRQTHEQRKVTHERKRRKQQAKLLADKYAESDSWFQLKRSLSELKRLATGEEPSFHDEEQKSKFFYSESSNEINERNMQFSFFFGIGTSAFSTYEFHQNSFSRPRTSQASSRMVFQPTLGATKPIYPYSMPHPPQTPSKSRAHSSRSRRLFTTPLTAEKRARLLLSDLSNEDNPPNTASPSPPMIRIERDTLSQKRSTPSPTRIRPPSIIKLNPPTPHSVIDLKFICICDEEHRIECWYHQYPFIHSNDLLNLFQSKSTTISAFFTDDLPAKAVLQGKPFHIYNDWKKYDLIFISNTISERILPHLQNILNQNKSIRISQLTHEENLKKQVKNLCKSFQQNL